MSPNTRTRDSALVVDLTVAGALGLAIGLSPTVTANRIAVKLLGGMAVAVVVFAYRRFVRRTDSDLPRRDAELEASPNTTERFPRFGHPDSRRLAILALSLALFFAISLPSGRDLLPHYLESVWQNGHGLLVPLLLVGVARAIRWRAGSTKAVPSPWGLVLIAGGIGLVGLDAGIRTLHLAIAGWIAIATGLVLVHFGLRTFRSYWPAIAMIAFFAPLSPVLGADLGMPIASAEATRTLLDAAGYAVNREASLIVMPREIYGVSARCSGFASLYAGAALAFAFAAAAGRWRRLFITLVLLWPIAIAANGLRLALLMMYCDWRGVLGNETPVHGMSGLLAFWMVIGAVVLLSGREARRALLGVQ